MSPCTDGLSSPVYSLNESLPRARRFRRIFAEADGSKLGTLPPSSHRVVAAKFCAACRAFVGTNYCHALGDSFLAFDSRDLFFDFGHTWHCLAP